MMMFLIAAAMAADTPAPATPPPPRPDDARSIVERQLASPPRTGPAAGLDSDEADMIYRRYIASIGEPIAATPDERPR